MIVVCKDFQGHCVLVVRRTATRTTAITIVKRIRTLRTVDNRDFDRKFKVVGYSPFRAIETWVNSPVRMTKAVREEIKMVIAILRNKVVAKAETIDELGELKPKTTVIDGIESLEGLTMKDLVKLYNTNTKKAERVVAIPDVEGDINLAADAVLAKLAELEVYKAPSKDVTPRVEKVYSFVKGLGEDEKLPKQAVCILDALEEAGSATKAVLAASLEGVLETKQPVERIIAFYQKRLVDEGYITIA